MIQFPPGALQHCDEIDTLIGAHIYQVRRGRIKKFLIEGWDERKYKVRVTTKSGTRLRLFPRYRGLAGGNPRGSKPVPGLFWFTNYWHAYACSLKWKLEHEDD